MAEIFFPLARKKESSPYRTAAVVADLEVRPFVGRKPMEAVARPVRTRPPAPVRVVDLRRELAAFAAGIAASVGVVAMLVRTHDIGARWPVAMLSVLGVAAVGLIGFLVWLRLRAWRGRGEKDERGP